MTNAGCIFIFNIHTEIHFLFKVWLLYLLSGTIIHLNLAMYKVTAEYSSWNWAHDIYSVFRCINSSSESVLLLKRRLWWNDSWQPFPPCCAVSNPQRMSVSKKESYIFIANWPEMLRVTRVGGLNGFLLLSCPCVGKVKSSIYIQTCAVGKWGSVLRAGVQMLQFEWIRIKG